MTTGEFYRMREGGMLVPARSSKRTREFRYKGEGCVICDDTALVSFRVKVKAGLHVTIRHS